MSLVSEALRKARREAEEQGRPAESRPRFFFSGSSRVDSRLGTGLLLGAIITVVAATAGGLVAWWAIGDRSIAASGQAAVAVSQLPEDESPTGVEVEVESPGDSVGPAGGPDDGQSASVDGNDAMASREADSVEHTREEPEHVTADAEAPAVAPPRRPPAGTINADGSREFVAVATIGDVSLTLGYLVYRPSDPFVQINGIDMRVGAMIEGFVIDEITRDRVVLHNDDGPVVIRVR